MPTKLKCFRVFIASPGGLADERKAFRDEIHELNDADANARGVSFIAMGWEDTLGGVGRPQSAINEDIRASDYFVLVLWNRWGSAPDASVSQFSSGSEEEYQLAMECYKQKTMRQVAVMFKGVDPQQLSDPGPQLQEVLKFRERLESTKECFYKTFDTADSFRKLIRRHLSAWARDEENYARGQASQQIDSGADEGGPAKSSSNAAEQSSADPADDHVIAKAWSLANAGRLSEAEVEFARATVGQYEPLPFIEYCKFLIGLGRLDQARVTIEWAITVAKDRKDQVALFNAYGVLAHLHQIRGELEQAEQIMRDSLQISKQLRNSAMEAQALGNLAGVLFGKKDLDGAEQMYRKALEIDEKIGRMDGIAVNSGNLGNVFGKTGYLDSAEGMYLKSLKASRQINKQDGIAHAFEGLANLRRRSEDFNAAEDMCRTALEIRLRTGDLRRVASDYGMLGIILKGRGDLNGAEEMARKALGINESLGDPRGMAIDYGTLGTIFQARGDTENAEEMWRTSIAISERSGYAGAESSDYECLGDVLLTKGDPGAALEMYEMSLAVAEKQGLQRQISRLQPVLNSLRKPPPKPTGEK